MAFKLDSVVPWGRNLNEYTMMFKLGEEDLSKKLQVLVMVLRVLIMKQNKKVTL